MSKHTPGPWKIVGTIYPSIKEISGPSFMVSAVLWGTGLNEKDFQKRMADMRLIAAAPELLEALERVKATGVFLGAIPQEMVDAAIAKAKGDSSIRGTSVNLILLDEIADRGE
jgi:hypothetical protein